MAAARGTPGSIGRAMEVGGRRDVRLSDPERHVVIQRRNDGDADGRRTLDELHQRLAGARSSPSSEPARIVVQ